MLHCRIHGFLHTELLVQNSFQSQGFYLRAAMKTQRLANIWKANLASSPSNCAPGFSGKEIREREIEILILDGIL